MRAEDLEGTAPREDVAVIDEDSQVRALANPERVRILALVIERPGTAKQVADWLGATRGRTHYHLKELEKAGLVEIVAKVENAGVIEKYYRAVARNFYMARGIGEHTELGGDVRQTIESSVLGWRRRQILDVDQEVIARKVIEDCLQTGDGDVVIIEGRFVHGEFIEPLSRAVQAAGAQCLVAYGPAAIGDLLVRWEDDVSSVIVIEEPLEYPLLNGSGAEPETEEEYATFLQGLVESGRRFLYAGVPGYPVADPAKRKLIAAGKRFIYVGYPTPSRARIMGIEFQDLHDACWSALDVNYGRLAERCGELKERLESAALVRVTSPSGTDITFAVSGREVFVDDGVISDWEVQHGRGWGHLPAGMVTVAPVPGTTSGVVRSDVTDYFGVRIEGIRIEFEEGEITSASAEGNDELLQLVLSKGTGGVRRLGGFELGMNPQIREPIGYGVWDSKAYGSVTIRIGDNRLIGGENEASLSWGFMVARPAVEIDGEKIVRHREFAF